MRCIKCFTENNLKDRKNSRGLCKSCGHEFAFDPKQMTGVDFTDHFFQSTLQKLSANNSLFFTQQQLYYFFNKQRNSKETKSLRRTAGWALGLACVFSVIVTAVGVPWLAVVVLLLVVPFSIIVLVSPALRRKLHGVKLTATPQQVDAWYRRWCRINGEDPKLLQPLKSGAPPETPAININAELKHYSFDRAVICDSRDVARCLIANNLHFESNSAVLSVDGYPREVFDTVMDMLRRNPELHVYALHDASYSGVTLAHILSTETRWFAGTTVKIFDLGLLPRQLFDRSVFVETRSPLAHQGIPEPIFKTLQPEELKWLAAGNFVSLESFPPQTLLRIVTRGIAKSRDPRSDDAIAPVIWADGDPGIYFFGAESFG